MFKLYNLNMHKNWYLAGAVLCIVSITILIYYDVLLGSYCGCRCYPHTITSLEPFQVTNVNNDYLFNLVNDTYLVVELDCLCGVQISKDYYLDIPVNEMWVKQPNYFFAFNLTAGNYLLNVTLSNCGLTVWNFNPLVIRRQPERKLVHSLLYPTRVKEDIINNTGWTYYYFASPKCFDVWVDDILIGSFLHSFELLIDKTAQITLHGAHIHYRYLNMSELLAPQAYKNYLSGIVTAITVIIGITGMGAIFLPFGYFTTP